MGDSLTDAVNAVIERAPGQWMYYCYNAEYLFHPFCETRSVGEMLRFHAEERRDAMLTYVIDLYAPIWTAIPMPSPCRTRISTGRAITRLPARIPDNHDHPHDRQLDFFGGLRWRFEEHIPTDKRRIDRIALFKARPGLRLRDDHRFSDEEYNTYACPWHNNLTAVIASFRTAKALKRNPGSTFDIDSFRWHNSMPFEWTSTQLLTWD